MRGAYSVMLCVEECVRCEGKSRCGCEGVIQADNGAAAYAVLDQVL